MIDLHCHLLWGMDDGARSSEESLMLCRLAVINSINAIVATPHFDDYYSVEKFVREREKKADELREKAEKEGIDIGIGTGAEVLLSDGIFEVKDFTPLSVNESRYVLCEYLLEPFDPKYAVIYAKRVLQKGFVPIIAHPERYKTFLDNRWIVEELSELGALFQVNVPSLAGKGGEIIKEFSTELVLSNRVSALGTDAHSPYSRSNDYADCRQSFDNRIDEDMLKKLTIKNPYKIISNKDL